MAESLAEIAGLTLPNLPSILDQKPIEVVSRFNTPYVTFCHPNSPLWGKILSKYSDAREAEQYLISGDEVTRLAPFKYAILTAKQYWVAGDKEKITGVSFSEKSHPYGESIDAVVLCYVNDKLIPASVQFRTTKCGAVHPMISAFAEATTAEWGKKSKSHELTMACQKPWMRFFGTVMLDKPRTSKSSGMVYIPASVVISPTSAAEWKVLAEHLTGDTDTSKEFYRAVEEASSNFERRGKELQEIASRS